MSPQPNRSPRGEVPTRRISIFLVDDHAAIRRGYGSLLQSHSDFTLVGETDHGTHAVRLISKARPDVVVLDVPPRAVDGSKMASRILQTVPESKIVALTTYGDDERVAQLIQAGVAGFLVKQTAVNDLVRAVREVQSRVFFSPLIAERLRHQTSQPRNLPTPNRELGSAWVKMAAKPLAKSTLHAAPFNSEASRRALAAA